MIKLTISIVTKNRIKRFKNCIQRLSKLPDIDQVHISIGDNSNILVYWIKKFILFYYGGSINHSMFHTNNFVECRNQAIKRCFTSYFTILDDDDYYTQDAISVMIGLINTTPADMYSYTVLKDPLYDPKLCKKDLREIPYYRVQDKVMCLNQFDDYSKDRYQKIYLWNCGHVMKTSILKNIAIGWGPIGCDDIIPITQMYVNSDRVIRVLHPIYLYPQQSTVCGKKSLDQCIKLESNIVESYTKLLVLYHDYADYRKLLLKKSIRNSIRQLQHIDNYEPILLIKLLSKI